MFPSIDFFPTEHPKAKPVPGEKLPFGKWFTDHMFVMDYVKGSGWIHPRIEEYKPFLIDPSAMVFHYGQALFEGLKAYRHGADSVSLFRPRLNFERMNLSGERMVIPPVDVDFCVYALKELVRVDRDWVPSGEAESLYIRPFTIAMDPYLGVRASETYRFMIIMSPSGAYYPQGINPCNIYVEDTYVRAVRGGTGSTKCAGNYAASLIAQEIAHDRGYVQVLWLDGVEQKYIEEVGAMNILFVIDDTLVTPALSGSILSGITRRTCLELAAHLGIKVEERKISIDEIMDAGKSGRLKEAFGTGTAAVVSPVGELRYRDDVIVINDRKIGSITQRLYDIITETQFGKRADEFGWNEKV